MQLPDRQLHISDRENYDCSSLRSANLPLNSAKINNFLSPNCF